MGDIVLLYEGDVVPADGVLLSGISLFTGQGFGFGICDCVFPVLVLGFVTAFSPVKSPFV